MRKHVVLLLLALVSLPATANAGLRILLTNDDGWSATGISAMRSALCAAGHEVTLVGPATNQSGRGGSMNVGVLRPASFMSLTRESSDACGARYSLAPPLEAGAYGGTPVDALSTGLDVLFAHDAPDLVVSGLNLGQNMSMPLSNASGTMGAAVQAALRGVPAIACSVSLVFEEQERGFPSTLATFEPAARFIVKLVDVLSAKGRIVLPRGTRLLNVNFPARYDAARGVALTRLAERGDLETKLFDVSAGFNPYRSADPASPDCQSLRDGASCSIGVGIVHLAPQAASGAMRDTEAVASGLISITPLDADMTGPTSRSGLRALRHLAKLAP